MIGQKKLFEQFDQFTLGTLPGTMLFVGESGCGKHTFCQQLANKFELVFSDITDSIDSDLLLELSESTYSKLILINADDLNIRSQNMLLKLLEEPSVGTHYALIAQGTSHILETVLNRCTVFRFEPYTVDELKMFIPDSVQDTELILSVAKTPGQVIRYSNSNFSNIHDYASKVVEKLVDAPYYNILNITNTIAFKEEQTKFNPFIFAYILVQESKRKYLETGEKKYLLIFEKASVLNNDLQNSGTAHFDIRILYDVFLLSTKLAHEEVGK